MLVQEWVAASRMAAIAVMSLELIAIELVNRIPPSSCVFDRVTLGLVNSMTDNYLLLLSSQNSESTAVHRALPRGHARGSSSPSHH